MKLLIIVMLSLAYITCGAQSITPYKGANAFIIRSNIFDQDSAYFAIGDRLVNSGYVIESANKDFWQFKTTKQGVKNYINLQYYIVITFNNGDFIIRPNIDMGTPLLGNQWSYSKFGYKSTKYYVVENDVKSKLGDLGEFLYVTLE